MEIIILSIVLILIGIYILLFLWLRRRIHRAERGMLDIFLLKVAKIPALIEVMRPYVADQSAFTSLTALHSEGVIREYESIYALLEQNTRIHREFLFLMKLSAQIPPLQTHAQFVYIRDFIIGYERKMKNSFSGYNTAAK